MDRSTCDDQPLHVGGNCVQHRIRSRTRSFPIATRRARRMTMSETSTVEVAPPTPTPAGPRPRPTRPSPGWFGARFAVIGVWLALIVLYAALRPETFLTPGTFRPSSAGPAGPGVPHRGPAVHDHRRRVRRHVGGVELRLRRDHRHRREQTTTGTCWVAALSRSPRRRPSAPSTAGSSSSSASTRSW